MEKLSQYKNTTKARLDHLEQKDKSSELIQNVDLNKVLT